jgi:ribosome-binding factor A
MAQGSHHPYPRSARVNQILREVIADAIERLCDTEEGLGLLTVTDVETSPDLRQAIVFFDSLSEDAHAILDAHRTHLQSAVNAQTRLKRTPKLSFAADPSVSSGEAVDELLRRTRHDDE